jgi:hypothetical protein
MMVSNADMRKPYIVTAKSILALIIALMANGISRKISWPPAPSRFWLIRPAAGSFITTWRVRPNVSVIQGCWDVVGICDVDGLPDLCGTSVDVY